MQFRFESLEIPEIVLIEPEVAADHRGFFTERFKRSAFEANGIHGDFVQDNHSYSGPRVLRGLHYQNPPKAVGKLVSVIRGRILDVAVDIRKGSPSFGRAVTAVLSSENRRMLWVPRGFAHGFYVLDEAVDVIYKMDAEYAPEFDRGILWNDPAIGIEWPDDTPVLSEKDATLPHLSLADNGFVYRERGTDLREIGTAARHGGKDD